MCHVWCVYVLYKYMHVYVSKYKSIIFYKMYMCVCVCVCVTVYMHVYLYMYVHMHVSMIYHMYGNTIMCIRRYSYMCMYYIYKHACVRTYIRVYVNMHVSMCKHIFICECKIYVACVAPF